MNTGVELDIKVVMAFFAFVSLFWLANSLNSRVFRSPAWLWPFPLFLSLVHGSAIVILAAMLPPKLLEISTGVTTLLFGGLGYIVGEKSSKLYYIWLAKKYKHGVTAAEGSTTTGTR